MSWLRFLHQCRWLLGGMMTNMQTSNGLQHFEWKIQHRQTACYRRQEVACFWRHQIVVTSQMTADMSHVCRRGSYMLPPTRWLGRRIRRVLTGRWSPIPSATSCQVAKKCADSQYSSTLLIRYSEPFNGHREL